MFKVSKRLVDLGADGYSKLPPDATDFEVARAVLMPVLSKIEQDILMEHRADGKDFNSGLFLALTILLGEHYEDCEMVECAKPITTSARMPQEAPQSSRRAMGQWRVDPSATMAF